MQIKLKNIMFGVILLWILKWGNILLAHEKKAFIHFNKEATYATEERVKFQNTSILIVSLLLSYWLT